eukprot:m.236861 g.236861  ORF g.236861 m.236861 type:complete len:215 (-) comp17106_c1_seq6:189-833(-)
MLRSRMAMAGRRCIGRGASDTVQRLIKRGANVMEKDKSGAWTPLHFALNVGTARLLIENGAEVMSSNSAGYTPLHMHARHGRLEVVQLLIERGAHLEAKNIKGKTPLHIASMTGQLEVARLLIERGAQLNARNNKGHTPLSLAKQEDMKTLLRKHIIESKLAICRVCMTHYPDHVVIPCGHMVLCADCAVQYRKPGSQCPIDRRSIQMIVKISE